MTYKHTLAVVQNIALCGSDSLWKFWNESGAGAAFRKHDPIPESFIIEAAAKNERLNLFYQRTKKHIATVQYFGSLYDKALDFSEHDKSKFTDRNEGVPTALFTASKISDYNMNAEENRNWRQATKHHDRSNKHHPPYWSKISFMPDIRIIEMADDWDAISWEQYFTGNIAKYGGTDTYYKEIALPRYKFIPRQQRLIVDVLHINRTKCDLDVLRTIWMR